MSVALPASPTRRRVRWGFGDVIWIAAVAFLVATVVGAISISVRHPPPPPHHTVVTDALDDVWAASAQFGAMIAVTLLLVRHKGFRGGRDLGVGAPAWRDVRFVALGVLAAIACNALVVLPVNLWKDAGHGSQEVGDHLQHAHGIVLALYCLLVVAAAPIAEEMLFRGVVLRAALRRVEAVPAVLISGFVFALFHLIDVNTFPSLAGLAALGCFSAVLAIRTGRLAPSIGIHMGFNLLGVVALLLSR